jgi:RNA polymerase sigma factor (sigma-70 family)
MSDYATLSDIELIEKCLEEDEEAWETLVRRYQRLIASIAVKFGLNPEDSADIFQSVCLVILEQLTTLHNQTKLSSWLITITVRECWKLKYRGTKNELIDDEAWMRIAETRDQALQQIEKHLLDIERRQLLRQSIETLSPQCRLLFEYLIYADPPATYAEISRRLNIPVASIGPIRGRCMAKLRESLKNNGFG